MIIRKILYIILVMMLDLCILATGALGGDCCVKGWVKCCEQNMQLEDIEMGAALMHDFGIPIQCCDFEKCLDSVKLETSVASNRAHGHPSANITSTLMRNFSEIPAHMVAGQKDYAEIRLLTTATYLHTLLLIC
jgi:hypothetical protein